MKKFFLRAIVFMSVFFAFSEEGRLFRFKYGTGDDYRILSTVKENVKINGRFSHYSEILNRVHISVNEVDENGRGLHEGTFMTSEKSVGRTIGNFTWGEEYDSKFWRSPEGKYEISDEYFMPIVRDVPIFPSEPVKIGDTWTAAGHEVHDLGKQFALDKPFKIPFSVQYTYVRDENQGGKDISVIEARYNLYYESPMPKTVVGDYPATTMGYSNQIIYWDNEKGQIDHYTEDFRILIDSALGLTFDFQGIAHAELTEFDRTSTDENVQAVQEKVRELGIDNVSVSKSEKGLTISIENIQFKANSSMLEESEQAKLAKIARILVTYPNDILVSGHTARYGSEESCQVLSEERADAVADFLINLGVRDKYHIMTIGHGSKIPIASNETLEGMERNRRVEITILDK